MRLSHWFGTLKARLSHRRFRQRRYSIRRQRVAQSAWYCEQLECRIVLTNDLFVITHGYQYLGGFPGWVYDMATAINSRIDQPLSIDDGSDEGSYPDAIEATRVLFNDNSNSTTSTSPFLLFDWADQSNNAIADIFTGRGWAELAGIRLFLQIKARLDLAAEPLNLHLIGHSRGAVVISEAINLLQSHSELRSEIGFVQMTTLDPHPVTIGEQVPFGLDFTYSDPAPFVSGIVNFADNYYQGIEETYTVPVTGDVIPLPHGRDISNAINVNITDQVRQWEHFTSPIDGSNHSEVWNWYLGTIDQTRFSGTDRTLIYSNVSVAVAGSAASISGSDQFGFQWSLLKTHAVGVTPPDDFPLDTFRNASEVTLGSVSVTTSGHVETNGDSDVFKFTASRGGQFALTLTTDSGSDFDGRIVLYDGARNILQSQSPTSGGGSVSVARTILKGETYYVRVRGDWPLDVAQRTGSYSLRFSGLAETSPPQIPGNLAYEFDSQNSRLGVSWNQATDPDSSVSQVYYEFAFSPSPSFENAVWQNPFGYSPRQFIRPVAPGDDFWVGVRAKDEFGNESTIKVYHFVYPPVDLEISQTRNNGWSWPWGWISGNGSEPAGMDAESLQSILPATDLAFDKVALRLRYQGSVSRDGDAQLSVFQDSGSNSPDYSRLVGRTVNSGLHFLVNPMADTVFTFDEVVQLEAGSRYWFVLDESGGGQFYGQWQNAIASDADYYADGVAGSRWNGGRSNYIPFPNENADWYMRIGLQSPLLPPFVSSTTPNGSIDGAMAVDHIDVQFSRPVDRSTFSSDDVTLVGPAGVISLEGDPIPRNAANTAFRLRFPVQHTLGEYTLTIGKDLSDLVGNQMDQDQDGVGGEQSADRFIGRFTITNSRPVFTSNSSFQVPERFNDVLMVAATDADLPAQSIWYSISGPDAEQFIVNGRTGALAFVAPPDIDQPADVGANSVYNLTITASDGVGGQSTQDVSITVSPINVRPQITSLSDVMIDEDTNLPPLAFTISDLETDADLLSVSATSSNTTLIPNGNLTLSGTGANRTLSVTPAANQSGTAQITITVSDGSATHSESFNLTVTPIDDAPSISDVTNRTTTEDTPTAPISISLGDIDTPLDNLALTAISSNPTLFPSGSFAFSGIGANRTLIVTPAADQSGSATITLTVSDGELTATDSFTLTVSAVNDAPRIVGLADRTTDEDFPLVIPVTITDPETAASNLRVTLTSSNTTLVPATSLVLTGTTAARSLKITPTANKFGTSTITMKVSDGVLTTTKTFLLTVTSVNDTPTISNITNKTTAEDTATAAISFTIGDVDTPLNGLSVTATSSNPTLFAPTGFAITGTTASRSLKITPAKDQNGTATVTVTVSDGNTSRSDTFVLTVTPVNDAPTIAAITNQTIPKNTATSPISVLIGDLETPTANLTLSATSSNNTLVPITGFQFSGIGANRTLVITPSANKTGTTTITVKVSDGSLSRLITFVLTVI